MNVPRHDVTQRRLAEERFRYRAALLARAERVAGVGAWEWDRVRDEFTLSEECARLLGTGDRLTRAELVRAACPEDRAAVRQAFAEARAGTGAFKFEFRVLRPDTRAPRFIHLRGEVACDQAGRPIHTYGAVQDVTERKQAERSLAQRTRELETLADNAPDIIVRLNRRLQYVFVNRRWSELMGVTPDDARGRTARALGLPEVLCRHVEAVYPPVFAGRQMHALEFSLPTTAGVRALQLRIVPELGDDGGAPQTILIIARDVTEQARLQAELIQAQKLEVVGRLAAGIAHDINNVLLAVSGYAALARRELAPRHPALENLAALERTVSEAGAIPRGLLTFTHRAPADRAPVNLCAVLLDAARLLQRLLPASIDLACEAPEAPPLWIVGDVTQMRQVILNLAINARDAMPKGGHLWIRLEAVAERPAPPKRRPLPTARLAIRDSGTGMAAEVASHVFEPFFTTKPRSTGTGLGLPIVKSIVESHGGRIELSSTPGAGTTVVIHLPCTRPPRAPRVTEARHAGARGRGEWILVADDNAQVLEVLSAGLRQAGYEPQQAADAPHALAHFAQHPDRIRLLIVDYDLPGGSGFDVLRKVRRKQAALPALVISGELGRDLDVVRDGRTRVLRKPFRLDDFTAVVTELLTPSGG